MAHSPFGGVTLSTDKSEQDKDGLPFFGLKNDGDTALIIPMVELTVPAGKTWNIHEYATRYYQHSHFTNGQFQYAFPCMRSKKGAQGECPVCDHLDSSVHYPSQRIVIPVYRIGATEEESGLQLWSFGPKILLTWEDVLEDEEGSIKGKVFQVKRRGAAKNPQTTYNIKLQKANKATVPDGVEVPDYSARFGTTDYSEQFKILLSKGFVSEPKPQVAAVIPEVQDDWEEFVPDPDAQMP